MFRKTLFFILLGIFFFSGSVFAGGDVLRGAMMAEKGSTIERIGLTYLPHVELEYGGLSADTVVEGMGGSVSDRGLALGLSFGKGTNFGDVFFKKTLSNDKNRVDDFGFTYVNTSNRDVYWGITLEQQTVENEEISNYFGYSRNYWKTESIRIKPAIGKLITKPGKKYFNAAGFGIILGKSKIDVERENISDGSNINKTSGDDESYIFGVFVQNKFGYFITNKLAFNLSLNWEGSISMDTPVINGDEYFLNQFFLTLRGGFQYRF